jgi:hypothetical protein
MKGLFTIGLAAALSFAACQFVPEPSDDAEAAPPKLTRAETLALMHLEDTHETGPEALKAKVNEFLTPSGGLRSAQSPGVSIREVRKFTSVYQTGFASGPAGGRSADLEEGASEIPFYLFTLESGEDEQTGFALTCGDNRVGNVLAVVEKGAYDLEDEWVAMYDKILDAHVRNTIDIYNRVTGADIAAAVKKQQEIQRTASRYLSTSALTGVKPTPLTAQTRWYNGYPLNLLINTVNGVSLSTILAVEPLDAEAKHGFKPGSAAIALAQIMAYHKKPQNPPAYITHQNGANQYYFLDPFNPSQSIAFNAIGVNGENAYNWNPVGGTSNGMLGNPNPIAHSNAIKKQMGVLIYAITRRLGISYQTSQGSYDANIPAFNTLYSNVKLLLNAWGFSYVDGNFQNADIWGSIVANKPVFAYGSVFQLPGYGWVIDNYANGAGGSPDVYWHCNVGKAEGTGNGWYQSTVFYVSGVGSIDGADMKFLTHIQ